MTMSAYLRPGLRLALQPQMQLSPLKQKLICPSFISMGVSQLSSQCKLSSSAAQSVRGGTRALKIYSAMRGHLSHELDVPLPADKLWAVFSSPDLPKLLPSILPGAFEKLEMVEGNGGVGTVLQVVTAPGRPGPTSWKEKFLKIDDATRTKLIRMTEGGHLDLGFTLYEFSFQVIEKDGSSCMVLTSVTFELDDKFESNASLVTAASFRGMVKGIANYAVKKNAE